MPDLGGLTLLYIAAFLDHEQACEWLLQQGATVYPQEEVEGLYHKAVFIVAICYTGSTHSITLGIIV